MYQRSEYHREEDRSDRNNAGGGWRSWLGLDNNKDKDDYHYSRTTTFRDGDRDNSSYTNRDRDTYNRNYGGDSYNRDNTTGTGYSRTNTYVRDAPSYGGHNTTDRYRDTSDNYQTTGRGGYGYQTSGEANRGYGYGGDQGSRGYSSDRDYQTQQNPSYYRSETRTYGGDSDRDNYRSGGAQAGGYSSSYTSGRYGGDNTGYIPTRSYGGATGGYGGDRDNTTYSRQQYSSRW